MNYNKDEGVAIPQSILTKIYDCTGSPNGGNKGFFLFYVNDMGQPSVASKTENPCVDMALSKLVELFVEKELEA
tara:strand:- start:14011 stop:14232 length:222 start_codon:yes stop_codon:yes gene_type:complete